MCPCCSIPWLAWLVCSAVVLRGNRGVALVWCDPAVGDRAWAWGGVAPQRARRGGGRASGLEKGARHSWRGHPFPMTFSLPTYGKVKQGRVCFQCWMLGDGADFMEEGGATLPRETHQGPILCNQAVGTAPTPALPDPGTLGLFWGGCAHGVWLPDLVCWQLP